MLIDTNTILDDILCRSPNAETCRKIVRLVTDGTICGYLTANCLTDIYYIVAKYRDDATARTVIRNLLLSFSIVSVTGEDCRHAIDFPMKDFEDALAVVCSEKAALRYIITNDGGFLSRADLRIPPIRPADFLLRFPSIYEI